MANDQRPGPLGPTGEVLPPDPDGAAQDPHNAAVQARIRRDHDEMQRQAERVRQSVSPEIRDRTIGEIVAETNRRVDEADRNRR